MRYGGHRVVHEFCLRVFPNVRKFVSLRLSQRFDVELLDSLLTRQQNIFSLRRVTFSTRYTAILGAKPRLQFRSASVTYGQPNERNNGDEHPQPKENRDSRNGC